MEQILTNAARQDEQILQVLPKAKGSAETEEKILSHAFLTIEEVATLLRVSKRTVYNLIYKGVLRATKVTYHVTIISKKDFLDMLERNSYVKIVALSKAEKHNHKSPTFSLLFNRLRTQRRQTTHFHVFLLSNVKKSDDRCLIADKIANLAHKIRILI